MKKYIFLLVLFLNVSLIQAQPGGPPGGCECCLDFEPEEGDPASQEYTDCINDCIDGGDFTYCEPVVPIDSNTLLLLVLGLSFGTYSIYQINKKRQFEK